MTQCCCSHESFFAVSLRAFFQKDWLSLLWCFFLLAYERRWACTYSTGSEGGSRERWNFLRLRICFGYLPWCVFSSCLLRRDGGKKWRKPGAMEGKMMKKRRMMSVHAWWSLEVCDQDFSVLQCLSSSSTQNLILLLHLWALASGCLISQTLSWSLNVKQQEVWRKFCWSCGALSLLSPFLAKGFFFVCFAVLLLTEEEEKQWVILQLWPRRLKVYT